MGVKRFYTAFDVFKKVDIYCAQNDISLSDFAKLVGIERNYLYVARKNRDSVPKAILDFFELDESTFYERRKK